MKAGATNKVALVVDSGDCTVMNAEEMVGDWTWFEGVMS
jgi:hypothetical protein